MYRLSFFEDALVVELVDTRDSNLSCAEEHGGSSPLQGIIENSCSFGWSSLNRYNFTLGIAMVSADLYASKLECNIYSVSV